MAAQRNQEYLDHVGKMDRPLPGSSLTNDPDQPFPFEKAPEYTSVHEASEYIFGLIIEEENYVPLMQAIADDYPLMDAAQSILFAGFSEGKWTPDLMLMLAEPTAYMLMALAERADIDFVVYREEDEDDDEEEELFGIKYDQEKVKELRKARKTKEIPEDVLPNVIEQRLDEAPVESLMSAPEEEEEEEDTQAPTQSLMAPPTQ